MPAVSTFSIVARDAATGDLGIAVASKFLAVGAVVPFAEADVGALATQSYANTGYGPRALAALRAGVPIDLIHEAFVATDDQHAMRQYGLVDAAGRSLSFTGDACHPWAGGVAREGVAAQGNLLAGPEVVGALIDTFVAGTGSLAERLLAALAAGDAAGGDRRGRQGAALLVVRAGGGYGGFNDRYIDLRVDDDPRPVARLGALLGLHRLYFERPAEEDLVPLEGDTLARVTAVLQRAGKLPAGAGWDARALRALKDLGGVENLEERLQHDDRIDRLALEHLERRYPG
ncbi:MAG TPA: DUF1028 domain-containing protein [Trueperaceae bacterium]|nr:DUF1028 domain-containing protein [Trueperaceae bacterium]